MILNKLFSEISRSNNHDVLNKWTEYLNSVGCNINNRDWYVNVLSDKIIQSLPNPYKKLTVKILSIVFNNATIKFEPDEEKLLRDNGFEELFPSQAPATTAATHAPNQVDAFIAKICECIKGKQLTGKELDKVIQSQVPIDSIPAVPDNAGYDDTEFTSIVRATDYPEFAKDEKDQARKKDDILKLAIDKYGKAQVYHYSNLLRLLGASLRMFDATTPAATN